VRPLAYPPQNCAYLPMPRQPSVRDDVAWKGVSMTDTPRAAIRTLRQRQEDTRALLRSAVDAWVASADAQGVAYLVPLSYYWDGAQLVIATPEASRTARNLRRAGVARVALGPPR